MPDRKIPPDVTELFAIQEVARRQWGKYWIPELTPDGKRILELNNLLGELADVSDLLRQQERERQEGAPTERQELTAARLQQARMLMQHQKAAAFLDGWALRKYPGRINRALLEAALAAALPEAEVLVDREPAAPSAEKLAVRDGPVDQVPPSGAPLLLKADVETSFADWATTQKKAGQKATEGGAWKALKEKGISITRQRVRELLKTLPADDRAKVGERSKASSPK